MNALNYLMPSPHTLHPPMSSSCSHTRWRHNVRILPSPDALPSGRHSKISTTWRFSFLWAVKMIALGIHNYILMYVGTFTLCHHHLVCNCSGYSGVLHLRFPLVTWARRHWKISHILCLASLCIGGEYVGLLHPMCDVDVTFWRSSAPHIPLIQFATHAAPHHTTPKQQFAYFSWWTAYSFPFSFHNHSRKRVITYLYPPVRRVYIHILVGASILILIYP